MILKILVPLLFAFSAAAHHQGNPSCQLLFPAQIVDELHSQGIRIQLSPSLNHLVVDQPLSAALTQNLDMQSIAALERVRTTVIEFLEDPWIFDPFEDHDVRRTWRMALTEKYGQAFEAPLKRNKLRARRQYMLLGPINIAALSLKRSAANENLNALIDLIGNPPRVEGEQGYENLDTLDKTIHVELLECWAERILRTLLGNTSGELWL